MAKDLASLSLDGGLLIVGVTDDEHELVGTQLGGLADRVGQVAASRISPPLPVTMHTFVKPGPDAETGALIVVVPASQDAPHMVAGVYWGRGPKGKQELGDSAVRRLLADQLHRAEGFETRLRGLADDLDPISAPGDRRNGHLYLLLEPSAGSRDTSVLQAVGNSHMLNLVLEGVSFEPMWSPSWKQLNWSIPHPDGLAGSSTDPSKPIPEERLALSVLLREGGAVQVASGAGSIYGDAGTGPLVYPGHVLELTHSTAQMAALIASKYVGYEGAWRAGIFLTSLWKARPSAPAGTILSAPFPRAEYVRVATTTTQQLQDAPEQLVAALTEPLLRGLGVDRRYLPYSSPEEIYTRHGR